jgi:D-cysteine desulfhydrase
MQTDFDHIVFASSSGGTHAGLIVGKKLLKKNYQLTGIAIDKIGSAQKSLEQLIFELAVATSEFLETNCKITESDLILNKDYTGAGYGIIGPAEKEAISLTARYDGILVDPVYTGRAMAGLIGLIRKGKLKKGESVLFWHTGGAPAIFSCANALQTGLK